MNWGWLGKVFPFIFGVLIGSGLSGNSNWRWIIFGYIIVMFVFGLLRKKIVAVKEATDKKTAIKEQSWEVVNDLGEATLKGNHIGANAFDRFYKEYAFYFSVVLLITGIVLLFYRQWLYAALCLITLNVFVVVNQMQRGVREIKEYLELKELIVKQKEDFAKKI